MKKSLSTISILVLLLAVVALSGTGCAKKPPLPPPVAKTEPPPPPPPPPAAPTVQLSASPSTIEKGQSTTLTWSSRNASNVSMDGGIGTVEASGSRSVSPGASTTYKITASGAGGTATAETRITVTVPPPPPPPPRTISDSEFFGTNVRDIYFDYDKYDIREDARGTLQGNARALAERAGIKFTIEGHCDERGSEKYNLALGDKRANSTKQYLVSQGVAADRVDTISYGEERQVCTDHNESCWQQNRRAHFVLR